MARHRDRVVIYARISADRTGEELGVSNQLEACYALAKRRELEVVGEAVDNSVSAYDRRPRPEFERVKRLLSNGDIDGVVIWHPDRLYRRTSDLQDLIAIAEHNNFIVYTVEGEDLDLRSPLGKMTASLISSVAEYEADQKATRQALANKARAARGEWHGGPVPFGYKLRAGGGGIEPDAAAQAALKTVLKQLRDGNTLNSVTKWLRTQGPLAPDGLPAWRKIKPQTLKALLTSPTIAGFRSYVPQRDRAQHQLLQRRGERPAGAKLSGTLAPAEWEPIFTADEWAEVKTLVDQPGNPNKGRTATKSLLAGVIFCSCGAPMGYSRQSYKCSSMATRPDGTPGCGVVSINTRGVEDTVHYAMQHGLLPRGPEPAAEPVVDVAPEIETLKRRRDALERALTDPTAPYGDDLSQFFEDRRKITDAIRDLQAEAERAAQTQVTRQRQGMSREAWATASLDERRAFLQSIPLRIDVGPAEYGRFSGPKFDPRRVRMSLGAISPAQDIQWFTDPPTDPWEGWPKTRPPKPKRIRRT